MRKRTAGDGHTVYAGSAKGLQSASNLRERCVEDNQETQVRKQHNLSAPELRMHALLKRALRAYKTQSRSGNGEPDVEQRRVTVTNVSLRFHCRLGSCFDTSRRRPYGFTKTTLYPMSCQRGFSEVLNGLFFSVCGVVVHSMEGEQTSGDGKCSILADRVRDTRTGMQQQRVSLPSGVDTQGCELGT